MLSSLGGGGGGASGRFAVDVDGIGLRNDGLSSPRLVAAFDKQGSEFNSFVGILILLYCLHTLSYCQCSTGLVSIKQELYTIYAPLGGELV